MKSYLELVEKVLTEGKIKNNRTGVPALTIAGAMLQHDLQSGFPLLTTKKMAFKAIRVELEFFIKGLTDKAWLKERGCHIWDEWCSPDHVPAGISEAERKRIQLAENDLGPIYGFQWRHFGKSAGIPEGVDQLQTVVETLKTNPSDRRLLVSAWNPLALPHQALPPCHVLFHLVVIENKLNLAWFQRSCDLMLGIPFNLASYSVLLHLLAKEAKLEEGLITGMLSDVHIYEDHLAGAKQQLQRQPLPLPRIETQGFTSIFDWQYDQTALRDYVSHPKIEFPIAV
ncbi:thymidylate synthase [candidate division FCPU426 bacterium]|nr:thymidylate synthase [candidate division FCPU426 bacterium]